MVNGARSSVDSLKIRATFVASLKCHSFEASDIELVTAHSNSQRTGMICNRAHILTVKVTGLNFILSVIGPDNSGSAMVDGNAARIFDPANNDFGVSAIQICLADAASLRVYRTLCPVNCPVGKINNLFYV